MAVQTPAYVNQTYFMGFNEPNNLHNCNTEPAKVAQAWKVTHDLVYRMPNRCTSAMSIYSTMFRGTRVPRGISCTF